VIAGAKKFFAIRDRKSEITDEMFDAVFAPPFVRGKDVFAIIDASICL
jgi:hypothetical protein